MGLSGLPSKGLAGVCVTIDGLYEQVSFYSSILSPMASSAFSPLRKRFTISHLLRPHRWPGGADAYPSCPRWRAALVDLFGSAARRYQGTSLADVLCSPQCASCSTSFSCLAYSIGSACVSELIQFFSLLALRSLALGPLASIAFWLNQIIYQSFPPTSLGC